jgi:hypothetical protein
MQMSLNLEGLFEARSEAGLHALVVSYKKKTQVPYDAERAILLKWRVLSRLF